MASELSSLTALCTPTSFLGVAVSHGAKPSAIKWTDSAALETLEAWVADHLHEFPKGSVTRNACEPVFAALSLGASSKMYGRHKKTLQDRVQTRLRTIVNATRIKAKAEDDYKDEDAADSTNTEAPPLIINSLGVAAATTTESGRLLDPTSHYDLPTPDSSSPRLELAPYPSLVEYDEDEDDDGDGDMAAFFNEGATSMQNSEPRRTISFDASRLEPSSWLRQRPDPSATLTYSKSGMSAGAAWAQNAPAEVEQRPPSALRTRGRTEAEEQRAADDAGKMLEAAAAAVGEKKAAEAAARSKANEKREEMNALFRDFFAQHRHHRDAPSATQAQILMEELQKKARKAVDDFNRAELERMELWHDLQMARVARIFCTRK